MRAATLLALFMGCVSVVAATGAMAEKRIALVIGNANYINAPKLTNPPNDATAVTAMLESAGFEVAVYTDLDNSEMKKAIRNFSNQARDADIATVYFAGHGIEVSNTNYLIPTDAKLERDADVEDEAIKLDRVLELISPARKLRLVILDACRDNPFIRSMQRTLSMRAIGRGLAKYEPTVSNTLVAFAASPGSTVLDGDGSNSPFTMALVKHLVTPDLDLRIAFGNIRDDVLKSTSQRQEPYISGSLGGGTIALVNTASPEGVGPAASSAATPEPSEAANAARDYDVAARLNTVDVWDEYLRTHSTGFYAYLARAQRAKLMVAAPAPAAVAAIPPESKETKTRTLSREEPPSRRERRREARHARGGEGGGGGENSNCGAARRTLRAAMALGFDNRDGVITAVHAKCGR